MVFHKCSGNLQSYYGGDANCAEQVSASDEYDSSELVCPQCSNVGGPIQVNIRKYNFVVAVLLALYCAKRKKDQIYILCLHCVCNLPPVLLIHFSLYYCRTVPSMVWTFWNTSVVTAAQLPYTSVLERLTSAIPAMMTSRG